MDTGPGACADSDHGKGCRRSTETLFSKRHIPAPQATTGRSAHRRSRRGRQIPRADSKGPTHAVTTPLSEGGHDERGVPEISSGIREQPNSESPDSLKCRLSTCSIAMQSRPCMWKKTMPKVNASRCKCARTAHSRATLMEGTKRNNTLTARVRRRTPSEDRIDVVADASEGSGCEHRVRRGKKRLTAIVFANQLDSYVSRIPTPPYCLRPWWD